MTRALLALVALVLLPVPVGAEHEVFYRYTLIGFVRDATGAPVADQALEVVRDTTDVSYLARTDASGVYLLITRLGDESAGEALTLKYGAASLRLTARFDPANHTEERGTRVDADGARLLEHPAWFRSTLARLLAEPKP